jgi:Na+-transporting NADH:ubiquinone oxidoreductase subunit C
MFSNKYIFIYATILVIAIAAMLSTTAKFLQPLQERNTRIAKIQDILTSAGIPSTRANAENLFDKHIVEQLLINRHGDVVNDGREPFDINLRDELRRLQDLEAGRTHVEPVFPLFISENNGQRMYIVPVFGSGLWGPLWGYVALKDDLNTIAGVVFDHQGETPGLGAEVSELWFQQRFVGRQIFDNNDKFVSVRLIKGGAGNNPHGVDALTGGTITSDGLSETIRTSLENYVPFFRNQRKGVLLEIEREKFVQDSIAAALQLQLELEAQEEVERARRRAIWRAQQQALEAEAAAEMKNEE